VFLTAFWAGLAAPTSLYAEPPVFRPFIANLTPGHSFGFVALLLTEAFTESQRDGSSAIAAHGEEQLAFEFSRT
jgi:hypothetical protein